MPKAKPQADHRVKVTLSFTPELLRQLDAYCDAIGVSRSAFVQTTVGQTLYNLGAVHRAIPAALEAGARVAAQSE